MMAHSRRSLALVLPLVLVACAPRERTRGAAGKDGGTLVIAAPADADNLFPPLTVNETAIAVGTLLFERLADLGPQLNTIGDQGFQPRLARHWTWAPDSLSIAFSLDPRARWQDGAPVTAHDVVYTFATYTNTDVGSPVGPLLAGIDSVTARDSATAVFWFHARTSEQFYIAAYEMQILPSHLLEKIAPKDLKTADYDRNPVGSGPYRFVRWAAGQSIELEADTSFYRGRPHLDRIIFAVTPDFPSSVLKLESGEADFVSYLPPPTLAELAKHPELKAVRYATLTYGQLVLNARDPQHLDRPHPIFGDRAVRRALVMAVDRRTAVKKVFDSLATLATGPVVPAQATFDPSLPQLPYAPDSARAILESRGWRDANGDGIREKDGRELRFTILVPTSSTTRQQMAVLLQDMFKKVGARVDIEQVDFPTHLNRSTAHEFDATFMLTNLDPSPSSIRQSWSTAAAETKGGSNYGMYESAAFDALVDSAVAQLDPEKARAEYRRAYAILVQDAPTIFLFVPAVYAGASRRIQPEGMRADAWWANLEQWWIPPDERIARDNISVASRRP